MPAGVPDHVFKLVVDSTALPIVLIDRQGVIHYASLSITRMLGWPPEEGIGRNIVEYLDPEDVPVAFQGLAEVETEADVRAGVPVVFPILRGDGTRVWMEVAVMPLFDAPELGLVALRLRPWESDHHLAEFMERLLADAPLPDLLASLTRSVAAGVLGREAAVHHGWDGERFLGVTGSWPGADDLPLDAGPWRDALDHDGVLQVDGAPTAKAHWLVRIGGSGLPPAVLSVWTDVGTGPLMGHRNRLANAARYVELALVRTSEHERLRHLAGHDALTGVANRASFRDRLARSLAIGEEGLAVAFCDLDGFKALNDTHGHPAGDDVLVEVAQRLRSALRDTDELARMGGDEFTVLCRGIHDEDAAEHVADRLLAAMLAPVAVPGGKASVGLSVGIAMAGPGATADGLLSAADEALYESKRAGGHRRTIRG